MAKSYYKQSERPVVEGINWGKIGTDLTTKLNEEVKRREDLKVEIDQASNDYLRTVQDTPQGQNVGANQRMSAFADNASKYMLDLDRKLKAGQIRLREYNSMRANLQQGTTDMFGVAKKFNASFDNDMLRASTVASKLEVRNNAKLQEFSNPSASDIIIDPITGQLSVVKMVEVDDGKGGKMRVPSSDPNDISSIFSLQSKQSQQIDKFDTNKFGEDAAKSFDNRYLKNINEGNVGTRDSILENPKFAAAKENYIKAALEPTYAGQSILADGSGDYEYSENIEDKGKEGIIVLVPDPNNPNSGVLVPDLTKDQYDEAYSILDEQFMARLGFSETTSLKVDRDLKQQTYDKRVLMNPIEIIKEGLNVEQLKELGEQRAEKHTSDMEAAESVEEKRQIELKYLDEEKQLKILNTETMMGERAAKNEADLAAAKTTEEKQRIQIKYLDDKLKLDNDLLEQKIEQGDKKNSTALKDYNTYVQNKYSLSDADISDDDIAEENLVMAYGDLGFKFETNMFFQDEGIKITSPDGETTTTIILDSHNAEKSIHSFINITTPLESISRLSKSGNLPKSDKKEGEVDAFGNPI